MNRQLILIIMLVGLLFPSRAASQSQEMQQLILNIEKLAQFRQILNDMRKGYQILNGGYNAVKDLSQGNFSLHETFLDALMQVSPTVRKYKRVGDIIRYQVLLIKEYKVAINRFRKSENFNADEIAYFEKVYAKLFEESLRNLDELTSVISANTLRMSDDERLIAIDKVYTDMQDKLSFLRNFNENAFILAVQRTKERNDVNAMRNIYKVNN